MLPEPYGLLLNEPEHERPASERGAARLLPPLERELMALNRLHERKSPAPSVRARRITACDSRESSKSNLQGNRPPKVKNRQIRLLQNTQPASPLKGFRVLHGRQRSRALRPATPLRRRQGKRLRTRALRLRNQRVCKHKDRLRRLACAALSDRIRRVIR